MRSGNRSSPDTTDSSRSVLAEHRGTEVSHTGDGFFVSFDRGIDAVEAAVAIQRRLAEHRATKGSPRRFGSGFTPTRPPSMEVTTGASACIAPPG